MLSRRLAGGIGAVRLAVLGCEPHPSRAVRLLPFQCRAVGICPCLRLGLGRSQSARRDQLEHHRALCLQPDGSGSRLGFHLLRLAIDLVGISDGEPIIFLQFIAVLSLCHRPYPKRLSR